ncbi:hypothetical protein AB0P21_28440 [Kribbella sp. NPDC056861]|uniref:hypothetical protein n=1 Tax=Kribbella sp. NPDC056861 TaxID=3154857 RepID=UPI0034147857
MSIDTLAPQTPVLQRIQDHWPTEALPAYADTWKPERVPLARRTTFVLWVLVAVGIGSSIGLAGILGEQGGYTGTVCSVATFGGHPLVTLLLAAVGSAALLVAAFFTRGLTSSSSNGRLLISSAAGLTLVGVTGILVVFVATMALFLATMLVLVCVFALAAEHS